MTLTHTPTLTLSTALEAFAVRLESRDEGAWQTLLSQVNPVFGDPIAAQVAHLMKTYKTDGEYDSQLIRKMLLEKDIGEDLEKDVADQTQPLPYPSQWYDPEEVEEIDEFKADFRELLERQTKDNIIMMFIAAVEIIDDEQVVTEWLRKQTKDTVIYFFFLKDHERDAYLADHGPMHDCDAESDDDCDAESDDDCDSEIDAETYGAFRYYLESYLERDAD
jgi:hypothetical protein